VTLENGNTIRPPVTTIPPSKDTLFFSNSQIQTSEFSQESSSQLLQHMDSIEIPGKIVTNESSTLFVAAVYVITATFIASLL